jgi:hypothetical protein
MPKNIFATSLKPWPSPESGGPPANLNSSATFAVAHRARSH